MGQINECRSEASRAPSAQEPEYIVIIDGRDGGDLDRNPRSGRWEWFKPGRGKEQYLTLAQAREHIAHIAGAEKVEFVRPGGNHYPEEWTDTDGVNRLTCVCGRDLPCVVGARADLKTQE